MAIGLYIHVPFCDAKCPYCDFYSLPADFARMDAYVERVCGELARWGGRGQALSVDTLYFGGGTPSLLGERRLARLVEAAGRSFSFCSPEITVEINPTRGKGLDFSQLRRCGINRLSIGLQSSDPKELNRLGRRHSAQDAAKAVEKARQAGFDNLSLDLMLAVPGQTAQSLEESVHFCSGLGVEHISAYLLKVEPGTPYAARRETLSLMDEDEEADQYLLACSLLEKEGYRQYEISNFSRPGRESRHNLKYWNGEEYLGIGPSAHSFFGGKRFYCPRDLSGFLSGPRYLADGEGGKEEEYVMLRLRLTEGLRENLYQKRFGHPIPQSYRIRAAKYQSAGLTQCDSRGLRLTRKGFLLSNPLIGEILLGGNQ
ncbi:MAG: radical SAM family heme chaperone HemW [Clostridiales bacterium]|jgi:oxygen-independent coproporphyrinogen-3 oxidase|nr:radical SAM family heme chaperone HemW [Clostridiales bacterium]